MGIKAMFTVREEREILAVRLELPVRYEEEDIPNDFPGRNGKSLVMVYDVISAGKGKVRDWPADRGDFDLHMKVTDEGSFYVLGEGDKELFAVKEYYVPDWVPGEYGDYVIMSIAADGSIDLPPMEGFDETEDD